MSKLSKKDVRHVAKLAKLKLSEKEIEKFRHQLSEVIAYVEELGQVKTDTVEPTSQTTGLVNIFRPDRVKSTSLSLSEALSGARETYHGYFVVEALFKRRKSRR